MHQGNMFSRFGGFTYSKSRDMNVRNLSIVKEYDYYFVRKMKPAIMYDKI
jgi:hypothetical protein